MSLRVCKGVFTGALGTGNQTISGVADGDGSFTPTMVLVWTTYQTAAGYTDEHIFQMGWADANRSRTFYGRSSDNDSANDCDRSNDATNLILVRNLAGTNVRVATWVSFGSDQFVINWSTVDAVAAIWHFVAIAGTDVTAHVTSMPSDTLVPVNEYTFAPVAGFLSDVVGAGDGGCTHPALGWFAQQGTASQQGSAAICVEDAQVTSDTWRYQRTVRCSSVLSASTGALVNDQSYGLLGIRNDSVTSATTLYLAALGGIQAMAGSGLQPGTTGTQAISGLGFTPKLVFLLSVGTTAQTTVQTETRWSLGAATGLAQGRSWFGATDAVNPSVTARGHSISVVITSATPNATGSSTAVTAEAALQSLDVDGFTLNWTTADATAREYLWLAMGDAEEEAVSGEHSHVFCG